MMIVEYELPEEIEVTSQGDLRIVTFRRPEALNAVNRALHAGLVRLWDQLAYDVTAKAVVITGEGKAFSAGGDMDWFLVMNQDVNERRRCMREAKAIARNQLACPIPLVAAVNGPAIGLGCSLALMCDYVVMADSAVFADPHVAVGLVAGDGGAAIWPLFMSILQAKQYVLLGDRLTPDDALRLGLCNEIVPTTDCLTRATEVATRLAALPTNALRDTKQAMNMHLERAIDGIMDVALKAEDISFTTDEVRDIATRFLDKAK
jgi:enoyl-CoA hydratase